MFQKKEITIYVSKGYICNTICFRRSKIHDSTCFKRRINVSEEGSNN